MKKSRSNNYWEQREQKWIEQRIKNDNAYLNEMVKRYEELANSIQQQINGFYAKYASDTGLTMSEAVKKINSFDVKSFEETAAKMVAKKDFSQYANDRLKIYNATMKINRLEFLKAQLGLEITNATNKEELVFNDYLLKSYQDELKRQSGILGYHKNVDLKQSATTVVNASFHGATWSSRLWINQDVLKAKLDTLLSRAMIQGTNPKQMIASLRTNIAKEINNATSVIENLVVTESARVQDVAQMESLNRNGFKFCKWIAEPTACKRCREIAESNNEHGIGVYRLDDVPMIPEHPRCRCSKAAYWVDEDNFLTTDVNVIRKRLDKYHDDFLEATGINVSDSIRNGTFSDTSNPQNDLKAKFVNYLLEQKGYTQLPKQVKEYSGTKVYRGVHRSIDGKMSADEIDKELRTGKIYISGANSSSKGRGIYVSEFEFQAKMHARKYIDGKVFEYGLNPGAKIITFESANKLLKEVGISQLKKTTTDTNIDIIAIVSGFDIIKDGATINVLNRGVLEWKKETKVKDFV